MAICSMWGNVVQTWYDGRVVSLVSQRIEDSGWFAAEKREHNAALAAQLMVEDISLLSLNEQPSSARRAGEMTDLSICLELMNARDEINWVCVEGSSSCPRVQIVLLTLTPPNFMLLNPSLLEHLKANAVGDLSICSRPLHTCSLGAPPSVEGPGKSSNYLFFAAKRLSLAP